MSKVLEGKLSDKCLPEAVEAAQIVRMVNQAIENTRQLARGLHPVAAEPLGLMAALKKWASEVEALFHISCCFQCEATSNSRCESGNASLSYRSRASDAAYSTYHKAFELARLLTSRKKELNDPVGRQEIFKTILDHYSYGMPDDIRSELAKRSS
jgi:signal transduction histidine kinase